MSRARRRELKRSNSTTNVGAKDGGAAVVAWISLAVSVVAASASIAAAVIAGQQADVMAAQVAQDAEIARIEGPVLTGETKVVSWYDSAGLSRDMYRPGGETFEVLYEPGDQVRLDDLQRMIVDDPRGGGAFLRSARIRIEIFNEGRASGQVLSAGIMTGDGELTQLEMVCGADESGDIPCEAPLEIGPSGVVVVTLDLPLGLDCNEWVGRNGLVAYFEPTSDLRVVLPTRVMTEPLTYTGCSVTGGEGTE